MKIIHCSDLHLDSKMETNLTAEQANIRNNEIAHTFARMANYANENEVSIVLITGDLFDTNRVTCLTADYILDIINKYNNIIFIYLRGNHDESQQAFEGRKLPKNLKLFSNKWISYSFGSIVVSGIELDNENSKSCYDDLNLDEKKVNIVAMHGHIFNTAGDGLVWINGLKRKFIDYLALGHYHSYQIGKLDSRGVYCYSGCLEGRGFDECGEKGFVLLTIEGLHVSTRFIPFATRQLIEIPVDITGLLTASEILHKMEEVGSELSSDSLVNFLLVGSYSLDTQTDLRFLQQKLDGNFFFSKIKDESKLAISLQEYQYDVSLKGEFIRKVLNSDKTEEEKDRIIRFGIQALSGENISL